MRSNESMLTEQGLILNSLEVTFNKDKISLLKTAYTHELYTKYKHNPDFFIYRFDDDLYIWKLRPTNERLPSDFKKAEITIEEHAPIFTKIVECSIVEFFKNNNREIFLNRYDWTWTVKLQKEKQRNFGALSLLPTLIFSLRNLYSKLDERQVIVLTLRMRMKPSFTGSEEVIKRQLTDTRGLTRNNNGEIIASADNRYRYLEATGQKQNYEKYRRGMESSSNQFEFLRKYTESFNKIASDLYMPDGLQILNFLLVNLPSASFDSTRIPEPQYFYYNERTRYSHYYDRTVSELWPYSFDRFNGQKLNILVVSPDEYEGSTDEYIVTLSKKLTNLFRLKNVNFDLYTTKPPETYLDTLDKIDANDYDLAVVVLSQRNRDIDTRQSPHYLIKAKLLNQRLPSQHLTIETLRKALRKRDPITNIINNNIALNIYAKLGGTAWTIEKSEKNTSELIIGIGSTIDDSGERIIGFANVFDYNGTYIVGDCSQLCTMDEYANNLEGYLVDTLTQAFRKKGLSGGERVRLIFHLFKEAGKKYELTAINNALIHFKQFDVQYSLVHLSDGHNFRILKNQGKTPPHRGTFIQLSSRQALIHMGGRSVVPIQVRLDKRSEYRDLYEITRQVLYFAHLSHRTFAPTSQPVTIKYPNLMARKVSELKKVPSWDYAILNKLNDKLWFI